MQGVSREAFETAVARCGTDGDRPDLKIAVGVSGGADSMALTLLLDQWARAHQVHLTALTVDHGLRAEAAGEADQVGAWLEARGIAHEILKWRGAKPATGIQHSARDARFALLTGWCRDHGVPNLFLAHNGEDQAETLLQRIGKDSGPDGLAGMRGVTTRRGISICRPLLDFHRADLEAVCRSERQAWVSDPSNLDHMYERVRLRSLLPELERSGISVEQLGRFARAMGRTRDWFDRDVEAVFAAHTEVSAFGYARFDLQHFLAQHRTLSSRFLARLTTALGGRTYPVRGKRLSRLVDEMVGPGLKSARTLGGCIIRPEGNRVLVVREWEGCGPAERLSPDHWHRWDNRFEIRQNDRVPADLYVSALGPEGWRDVLRDFPALADRARAAGIPHEARLALPKITQIRQAGAADLDAIVAVPHLMNRNDEAGSDGKNGFEVEFVTGYRLFSYDSD